jgi:threonine/homoserine/homoserine lactone efflux protein
MSFLLEGIKVGVLLALMVGPLFFTLIQTGVEEGFRAGAMVGFGIWISDCLYAFAAYGGLSYLVAISQSAAYTRNIGIAGSLLLATFGLISLFSIPKSKHLQHKELRIAAIRGTSYFSLWMKGFLINTVNPFTIFFWLGLVSAIAVREDLQKGDAVLFFTGIIGIVILTDLLKVFLAKQIRLLMRPAHILWLRRVSGAALLVFGIALFIRSTW